jgi:hypothetical protein
MVLSTEKLVGFLSGRCAHGACAARPEGQPGETERRSGGLPSMGIKGDLWSCLDAAGLE